MNYILKHKNHQYHNSGLSKFENETIITLVPNHLSKNVISHFSQNFFLVQTCSFQGNFEILILRRLLSWCRLGSQRGFNGAPRKQYSTDFVGSRLFETSVKQSEQLSIVSTHFPNLSDDYLRFIDIYMIDHFPGHFLVIRNDPMVSKIGL